MGLVAELGEGGGHALVVACGAQEVVEDLQDGTNISSGTAIAVLAVRMQSALEREQERWKKYYKTCLLCFK